MDRRTASHSAQPAALLAKMRAHLSAASAASNSSSVLPNSRFATCTRQHRVTAVSEALLGQEAGHIMEQAPKKKLSVWTGRQTTGVSATVGGNRMGDAALCAT